MSDASPNRILLFTLSCMALLTVGGLTATGAAADPPDAVRTVRVAATESFDAKAFSYEMSLLRDEDRYRVYRVSYPSPVTTPVAANNTIPAEYYVPVGVVEGEPARPAVICLHILNGNFELVRLLCTVLAESGVPALFFKLPYYGERSPPEGRGLLLRDVRLFAACLEQSLQDIRRTVDVLASRPEVNPARIGISGISLGAIMSASACGVEPRLWRAQLILGGGDLPRILTHSRETRGLRQVLEALGAEEAAVVKAAIERVDPLRYTDALRALAEAGRLAMVNATDDEVIPRECTMALAEKIGMDGRITWLDGLGHYTAMAALPRILRSTAAFFAQDLPEGSAPPPVPDPAEAPPLPTFMRFVQEVVSLAVTPPAEGTCHYLDLTADIKTAGGREKRYQAKLILGARGRFSLTAEPIPEVGSLAIGNGEYPWMRAKDGRLFLGTKEVDSARGPGLYIDPAHKVKLLAGAGALMAMTMAPGAFRQYVQVSEAPAAAGERALAINLTYGHAKGTGTLILKRPAMTPLRLLVDAGEVSVNVTFRQWRLRTVSRPQLFEEPRTGETQQVAQEDLLRMFASTFNFAMEKLQ